MSLCLAAGRLPELLVGRGCGEGEGNVTQGGLSSTRSGRAIAAGGPARLALWLKGQRRLRGGSSF